MSQHVVEAFLRDPVKVQPGFAVRLCAGEIELGSAGDRSALVHALDQRFDRALPAEMIEHRRVHGARNPSQAVEHVGRIVECVPERRVAGEAVTDGVGSRQSQHVDQQQKPLTDTVVKILGDPPALGVLRPQDARAGLPARGMQCGVGGVAGGFGAAHPAREHQREQQRLERHEDAERVVGEDCEFDIGDARQRRRRHTGQHGEQERNADQAGVALAARRAAEQHHRKRRQRQRRDQQQRVATEVVGPDDAAQPGQQCQRHRDAQRVQRPGCGAAARQIVADEAEPAHVGHGDREIHDLVAQRGLPRPDVERAVSGQVGGDHQHRQDGERIEQEHPVADQRRHHEVVGDDRRHEAEQQQVKVALAFEAAGVGVRRVAREAQHRERRLLDAQVDRAGVGLRRDRQGHLHHRQRAFGRSEVIAGERTLPIAGVAIAPVERRAIDDRRDDQHRTGQRRVEAQPDRHRYRPGGDRSLRFRREPGGGPAAADLFDVGARVDRVAQPRLQRQRCLRHGDAGAGRQRQKGEQRAGREQRTKRPKRRPREPAAGEAFAAISPCWVQSRVGWRAHEVPSIDQ